MSTQKTMNKQSDNKKQTKKPKKDSSKTIVDEIIQDIEKNIVDTDLPDSSVDFNNNKKKAKKVIEEISDEIAVEENALNIEEQNQYFGLRKKPNVSNSILMYERFGYKRGYHCKEVNCYSLIEKDTQKPVGIIPRIALHAVWDKAQAYTKGKLEQELGITKAQWDEAYVALKDYISNDPVFKERRKSERPIIIQDVLNIPELVYKELFIEKASEVIRVIDTAIKADIQETLYLKKRWHKIKKYSHKVALAKRSGGIFSDADTAILERYGIRYLNDLRKQNIYALKNMLLEHSFARIQQEINKAFKEDLARRKDFRYKLWPFIFGNIMLTLLTLVGYQHKYTLIKNELMTLYVIILICAWSANVLAILFGMIRTKWRTKKRPDYKYFTRTVKRAIGIFGLFSLFALGSIGVFYERYDGYDDMLYYRDLGENKIAVAGLADSQSDFLIVPEMIDGKTVVEIDIASFRGDEFVQVSLPSTVEKIDKFAFLNCESLTDVHIYNDNVSNETQSVTGISSIGYRAFKNCKKLEEIELSPSLTHVESGAFRDCINLNEMDFSNVEHLGKGVFCNCSSLQKVQFADAINELPAKTFENCDSIEEIVGFSSMTKIGEKAFFNCRSLIYLDFNDDLQTIGKRAFQGCSSLIEVTIPRSLQTMGKHAFKDCTAIGSLTIPFIGESREKSENASLSYLLTVNGANPLEITVTDMTSISKKNFKNCALLKSVNLSETVTSISAKAFKDTKNLVSVNISNAVTVIEKQTFKNCHCLESVTGGDNVTSIGESAFEGCGVLREISFPKVEYLGERAFANCFLLSSLGDYSLLKTISAGAFSGCESLLSIQIPVGVKEIGDNAFEGSFFNEIRFEGIEHIGNSAFKNSKNIREIDISSCSVASLGEYVFEGCSSLEKVILPEGLSVLPKGMLKGCSALTSFVVENGVEVIGEETFKNSGLSSVMFADTVRTIGKSAFENCPIDQAELPNTLETIGKDAFKDCTLLTTVKTPFVGQSREKTKKGFRKIFGRNTPVSCLYVTDMMEIKSGTLAGANSLTTLKMDIVENVDDKAFYGLSCLETIELPQTLTRIGKKAFKNCGNLTQIDISQSCVTQIGEYAFENCHMLTTLELPTTLNVIEAGAFESCHALNTIMIPEGVEKIGANAFRDCFSLATLVFPNSVYSIGESVAQNCTQLNTLSLSCGLTEIPKNAFRFCESLGTVVIPDSIEVIDKNAFYYCDAIENVDFGVGLKRIEDKAFAYCSSLKNLILNEGLERLGSKVLMGCSELLSIRIPHTVNKMGGYILDDCDNLTHIETPFVGRNAKKAKRISYLTNSEYVTAITITNAQRIAKNAFKDYDGLEFISFNEGIKTIGEGVVEGCTHLQKVELPESLREFETLFPAHVIIEWK